MLDQPVARRRLDPTNAAFILTIAVLAAITAVVFALRLPPLRVVAPALDLTFDTIATVVTLSVAGLAWVRYRERREAFASYQAAAFLAIALGNLAAVLATLFGHGDLSLAIVEPGPEHLHVFAWTRLIGGGLLVAGGVATLRGRVPAHPRLLVGAVVVTIVAMIFEIERGANLPALVEMAEGGVPAMTPLGSAVHVLGAGLYGGAAWLTLLLWRREGAIGDRFVAFGLVLAAFAQLHAAVYPGTHPGPVSSADVLRIGFDVTLLLAIEAEASEILAALRRANARLEGLRQVEVDRAALEERARLSRELHDGLAQALWLAKLKIARLSAEGGLPPAAEVLASDAAEAVELGLSEARQAVLAMRVAADTSTSFSTLLERYVEDHADRFGLRVEFACPDDLPQLPARTQAELLRIAQEALANVRRHAGASRVLVQVEAEDGAVRLSVADDGRGFDPGATDDGSFGLAAMRERAGIVGGSLAVRSAPGSGAEILVVVPVDVLPTGGSGVSPGRMFGTAPTTPEQGVGA